MSETYEGPDYGPCLWPVDPSCLTAAWDALSADVQERGLALASSTLNRLTGGRVGGCPIKIRPVVASGCPAWAVPFVGSPMFRPGIDLNGMWVNNIGAGGASPYEIALPTPVGRIDEVKVNGTVLFQSDYRVDSGNLLVWQGAGDAPWPLTQDVSAPDTEAGTFSVTMLNSYPVDRLGAQAAAVLALEFAKACSSTSTAACRLPSTVVSVVRQGVSYQIQPGLFPDGFTGIKEVDAYITSWNPRAQTQDAAVWSPGVTQPRVQGGAIPYLPPGPGAEIIIDGGGP